ncbi:MAG: hypothetical protein CM1200mP14_01220 [Gammaproteobacteria bacterium]|nr:MAG: hypothetical protein CM1200mP14_01220 [Gammaproteobacteria bacterium]
MILSSPDQRAAAKSAEAGAEWVRRWLRRKNAEESRGVELVGPAPAPIERLHGRWRWHFFLRSTSPGAIGRVVRALIDGFKVPGGDVRLAVDRDPVALL